MMNWSPYPWWLPGAALAFFGVMIAIFPELLALLVASAFLLTGLSWLMIGWSARVMKERKAAKVYYYERW